MVGCVCRGEFQKLTKGGTDWPADMALAMQVSSLHVQHAGCLVRIKKIGAEGSIRSVVLVAYTTAINNQFRICG